MRVDEMLERRAAAEDAVARSIGLIIFEFSRFVTALHLCVAWFDDGSGFDDHVAKAAEVGVADLINRIEKQGRAKLKRESEGLKAYLAWARGAHRLREERNAVVHSRWGIAACGEYAVAVTTPVLVEPPESRSYTVDQLEKIRVLAVSLQVELNRLRREYPI